MGKVFINPLKLFRNQYFLLISTIVATIVSNQLIIQYDLKRHSENARLINAATTQRTLSQTVAKEAFLHYTEVLQGRNADSPKLQSVLVNLEKLGEGHSKLVKEGNSTNQEDLDSLFRLSTRHLEAMVKSGEALTGHDSANVIKAVAVIHENEKEYLQYLAGIAEIYQVHAEEKLSNLKRIEIALAAFSVLLLVLELVFLFLPILQRVRASNVKLQQNNADLMMLNLQLHRKQGDFEATLSEMNSLRNDLAEREKQYRELVEQASDMIYELDENGKFSYVNPVLASSTEFSEDELRNMVYDEIIAPDHRPRVREFYKQQRKNRVRLTYLEFPVVSKTGAIIWIGQNVRMTYSGSWVSKVSVVARDITILHNANLALQSNEELFRTLAQNAPVGIYKLNAHGRFAFVNRKWNELTGVQGAVNHERHFESIHPEDRINYQDFLKKAVAHHEESSIEVRYVSGHRITWTTNKITPVKNKEGIVTGFIGTLSNISVIKESLQMLEEGEKRFRLLAANAPVGIFETDAAGSALYMNKAWYEITRLSSDALGHGWVKAIHEDDREIVVKAWSDAVRQKKEVKLQFRFHNQEAGTRWVIANAIHMLDEADAVRGYIGTMVDITELKDAQEKISESEKLYRLLSTNAKDLMVLHKADQMATRIYVSPSAKEILGFEPEELIGKSPYDLMVEEDAERIKIFFSDQRYGSTSQSEFRVRKKDGTIIWLESYTHPFFDQEGTLLGFQSSARDITLRKEFESNLQMAKTRAEEATLAKSQFLSMMSHEIRTPMNGILGLTNILLDEEPTPSQKDKLKLLKFSGDNLLLIINDILDFSKIEAGRIVLEEIDFDVHELVENIRRTFIAPCNDKKILLGVTIDELLPRMVKGDPLRLGQVLNNLLSNAIKFTEEGQVQLDVKVVPSDTDRLVLRFVVSDTGIGISADQLENIFKSFSQGSSETTRKYGGTGLGLSITKHLLQLMGSSIKVESRLGFGSSFGFTIAFKSGLPIQEMVIPVSDQSSRQGKVLLVEDNPINQLVAQNFLVRWGLSVDCAKDGKEALRLIANKGYHMVLMDLQMPVMDGYEATKQIRQMQSAYFKKIPIIALTASAMSDTRNKVLEIGMNDFILKPFEPDDLRQKLEVYLKDFRS
jgi:PAS domain S-box-containing protein